MSAQTEGPLRDDYVAYAADIASAGRHLLGLVDDLEDLSAIERADFEVTVTFCFTPEHRGIAAHHTSPPLVREEFAEFCAAMVRRYADRQPVQVEALPIPEMPFL